MRARTLLVLLAIVGLFVWLQWRRGRETTKLLHVPVQEPLLPGLAHDRVATVRIDNLERSIQVKLERDASGAWFLTDPVAYPAVDALVRMLLETLERAVGEPASNVELEAVGLDPPLVVVELEQREGEGTRAFRIEVGQVDLDPDKIYVFVPELSGSRPGQRVFRTLRTIYSTLDRNPDDYRDRRATHLEGREVIAFTRTGRAFLAERAEEVDLAFSAVRGPEGWMRTDSAVVRLDPNAIGVLARAVAELKVEAFVEDAARSTERWGLDPPLFSIELGDARGDQILLHFGHPEPEAERWFARREGFPHVWEVSPRDVALFSLSADDLIDTLFLRARREDLERVECEGLGRRLVLERDSASPTAPGWRVWEERDGASASPEPFSADAGAVQDWLAALEHTELEYPPGAVFVPEEPPLSIVVTTRDGVAFGGKIGKPWRDPTSGAAGRAFQRLGDERAGLIEEAVTALAGKELDELRSREIHRIREPDVRWIKIARGEQEFSFIQASPLEWIVEGSSFPAPSEFTDSLELLLALDAERWLEGLDSDTFPGSLEDALDFRVQLPERELRFRLGRTVDGVVVCVEDGHAAEVKRSALASYAENFGTDLMSNLQRLFAE